MERVPINLDENFKYDIVFIGGGPSVISYFSYLLKNNILDTFMRLNILIIEKSNSFGSGCIGKYGINSNTSAEGFVRLISNSNNNNHKNALSPCKKKNNENSLESESIVPLFKNLYNSKLVRHLLNYGNKPAPLSLIGTFLDSVGNTILEYIFKTYNSRIMIFNSEVTNIIKDKEIFEIKILRNNLIYKIETKILVMATGGIQRFDNRIKNEIYKINDYNNFFHSDYVLQEKGYKHLIDKLQRSNKKKVLIIGGSHSAFSCAWILLNEPSMHRENLDLEFKINSNCTRCNKEYCCFGEVKSKTWDIYYKIQNIEISIIYQDHIKVYYHSEKDALNDGYNFYDPKKATNKNGNVYPFIGLRADAKELYRRIMNGKEKRVKLIKCETFEKQIPFISEASVIIWACGYTTQNINFCDIYSKDIFFHSDHNNQVEVNKDLNLMDIKKATINNLFGIGQGYSTHSVEILRNGKNARADSISLYNTYIAKKLFRTLELMGIMNKQRNKENKNNFENIFTNNQFNHNTHNNNNNPVVFPQMQSTKRIKTIVQLQKKCESSLKKEITRSLERLNKEKSLKTKLKEFENKQKYDNMIKNNNKYMYNKYLASSQLVERSTLNIYSLKK